MSRNADIYSVPSFRVTIPAGAAAQIGPFPGQLATSIKLISGGTLEIGAWGASLNSGALNTIVGLTGTIAVGSSQVPGQMYPLSSNEVFSLNSSGVYVLYASSATCVVAVASGRSAN